MFLRRSKKDTRKGQARSVFLGSSTMDTRLGSDGDGKTCLIRREDDEREGVDCGEATYVFLRINKRIQGIRVSNWKLHVSSLTQ